jgi:ATP-dependent DNA helicase RecG
MIQAELEAKLAELVALPQECEWVEFKDSYAETQQIGEYLSALSNSAALHRQPHGYIVWGVENGSHDIIGTSFKPRQTKGAGNEDFEPWLARLLSPRMEFRIYEFPAGDNKPMVLFQVQAANSSPVAFSGREYIRVGSHKKPLVEFKEKERELWKILSAPTEDWSKQLCDGATLNDLDPLAIKKAREVFKIKHPKLASEVDGWDDPTFLNKAKICIEGVVTNAAIILLGKEESTHFISPSVAQMTWVLKSRSNVDKDYRHYGPPFLLAVDQLFANVRNLTIRHLPDGTLFPIEVSQYDPRVLREILHNCIAHQDYSMKGRINVVEVEDDSILFTNLGQFLPGSVEEVIRRDQPQEEYRNRFLVDAMVNLNMIDTIGSGIRRSFGIQRERNFPMPTYDLNESGKVKVRVIGQILDPNYTRMLMSQTNLDLLDVIALDKVQKGITITEEEVKSLRNKKLIEGRRPNIHVSSDVAAATDTMVDYLTKRGIDKDYCQKMVVELLSKKAEASRPEIESLLMAKLSDALDDEQKRNFIKNLLQEMKREGIVRPIDGKRGPGAKWELSKKGPKDEA